MNLFWKKLVGAGLALSVMGFATGCDKTPAATGPNNPKAENSVTETSPETAPTARKNTPHKTAAPQAYQEAIEARLDAGLGVGLAMSIIDRDTQAFIIAGNANAETGTAMTQDNLFEIGSITKTFTGVLLADMALRGEVKLNDPVSKYLPDSVTMPSYKGQEITLEDLAAHRSSLPRMPSNFAPADPTNPYADYTPKLLYEFLSGYRLKRPIGEKVEYSNLGLGLLGHVLERRSGMSYEALVKARIAKPLGMKNTFMVVPNSKKQRFATGHDWAREAAPYWDINTLSGAGALRSDIKDMTLYLKANMGLVETELSEALQLSHKMHHETDDSGNYIGLAWFTENMDGKKVTWHNGATAGFRSFMGFDPEHKRGVVVLSNGQGDPDLIGRAALTHNIDSLLLDEVDPDLVFTDAELEKFVGKYQLAPTFIITVSRKDNNLFAQATGQSKFPIFPKSDMEFFFKVVDASLIFKADENGEIISLTLDQAGMMQPAPKL